MCATRRGRETAECRARRRDRDRPGGSPLLRLPAGRLRRGRVRPRRPRAADHHTRASARALEPQGADPLGPGRDEPGSRGRRVPGRGRRRARPSRRGDADGPVARARTRLGPALGPLPRDACQPAASVPADPQAEPIPGDRDDPMQRNLFAPPELPGIEFQRERGRGGPVPFAPHPPGDEIEAIPRSARTSGSSLAARDSRRRLVPRPIEVLPGDSRVSRAETRLRLDRSEHREQARSGALDDPGPLVGRDRPAHHDVVQQGERTPDHVRLRDADLQ